MYTENEADALKALVRRPIKNTWFEESLDSSWRSDSEGWCSFFSDHFSYFSMRHPHYLFPLAEKHLDVETMLPEVL